MYSQFMMLGQKNIKLKQMNKFKGSIDILKRGRMNKSSR